MKNEILVLEVNGRKNILEYQKTLYEAAVLGISHVMFVIILDGSSKHEDNINSMCEPLYKTCDILKIQISSSIAQIYGNSFIGNSVGNADNYVNVKSFLNLTTFSNYKRRKRNCEKLATAENFEKVYSQKFQQI